MTTTNEMLSNLDIKYHFLIDNILDVVGELDLNGIFTYVNPYIYDELGYQPDEIIGREIYEFVHPDDAKKMTKVLLRRPKSHDFIPEIRLKNDKNQFIWYEIKARRIKDYNNQSKIIITLKNISKVKVLEEKLEKKEENYQKITNSIPEIKFWKIVTPSKYERAVRTTSEMLKVIVENIPQCVFWKDTNFKYLGCNGNYSEFIGIEHLESIVGKTDEDLLSNREKIQQIRESETNVMSLGKPLYHTYESWISEKGENIWLDINRVPLIDAKGDINGILVTFEEITDRKIAEEKLQNSEKKYKNLSIELETIIDIIPSMIFVKNKGGIYNRVNQVFADYLKLEKEDIIGKSTFDLFPQELATNLNRDDLEVIKSGIPKLNIEETVEFPGGIMSGIISKMPYYNEKDEINGMIGFAIDISERKELEQRLIKSEERYRLISENAKDVIWTVDMDLNFTYISPACINILGYTDEECINLGFRKYTTPDSIKILLDAFKEELKLEKQGTVDKKRVRKIEIQQIHKNGSIIDVELTLTWLRDENGKLVDIIGLTRNITERKEIEKKIRESEEKYRTLVEKSLQGMCILQNVKIVFANNALAEIIGYSVKELYSLSAEEVVNLVYKDDKDFVVNLHKERLSGKKVSSHYEFRIIRKDNQIKWVDMFATLIEYEGKPAVQEVFVDISDKKKAEQKLKESEENYRLITENANDIIAVLDDKFRPEYINETPLNKMLGYNSVDLIGILDLLVIHPDDRKMVLNGLIKGSEVGKGIADARLRHKDGRYIWVESRGKTFIDKNGEKKILFNIRNITERKKVEKEIKESQKKYKLLSEELELILDHILGLVFYKDTKNSFIWVNKYITDAHKMKREDLIGKSLFELYPEEVAQTYWDDDLEVINSGKPKLNIEESWETADGLKWVLTSKMPYIDEKGDIKGIIGTSVDITERKIAEQKLIESEAKHRGLLETAVMGLIEIDLLLNKISYINPKLLEIVGYTKEELKNDSFFYNLIHPEDLEDLLELHGDRDVEFRIYSKEGKLKWLSGTRKYTVSENGELINVRLWLQDITESKEVEEIKSNLLTRFSHEFKTPLISITGFADFLLTEHKKHLDGKTLLFLKRIKDGGDRLKNLVNSFAESSQLGKAIIQVNLRQENLYNLINEALDELEGVIHMREHEINLNVDKHLITNFDREKVYTVITNLLINAINYTPKGGKISIHSKINKKSIVISIKDNGIGLDESEIILLFKPFGKIERYGKGWDIAAGGMGMGLYISKEIIELHGGKIGVESEGRNKGSTFYFSIPMTK